VIAKILDTLDPAQALQLANQEKPRYQPDINEILPPVVTLLSPQVGSLNRRAPKNHG